MDVMLPPSYFTQELRTMHLDLVVLNDLLLYFLPKLSSHLKQLQYEHIQCILSINVQILDQIILLMYQIILQV